MSTKTKANLEADREEAPHFPWMRLALGAAITMVTWAIVLQGTAGLIIPPVAAIGVAYLVFVPFLRGEKPKLGLGLAVLSFLVIAGNLPVVIDELAHPESAPAFILTLLAVTSALVAMVAGLGAFRRWSPRPIRSIVLGAGVTFLIGAIGSAAVAVNTQSDPGLETDLEVVAEGVAWEQAEVVLEPGHSGVWVDNRDGVRHTFTIPDLGVDLEVPALKARRVVLEAPAGSYQIVCMVPGHEAMTATLIVTE